MNITDKYNIPTMISEIYERTELTDTLNCGCNRGFGKLSFIDWQ